MKKTEKVRPEHGYWIIPPEIYNPLNKEFKFQFDHCPNPRPKEFDGLAVDWKKSNWVNPPFWAGITAWVRKAIVEQQKGNTSVLILPLDNWVNLLLQAGAELRPVGSHEWIHTQDGSRRKAPRPSILFILRGGTNFTKSSADDFPLQESLISVRGNLRIPKIRLTIHQRLKRRRTSLNADTLNSIKLSD